MISGIHPEVAQTIVALGLDLRAVRTVGSLRAALAEIVGDPRPAR
jgi:anti-anti-sigma regulatory factor